MSRSYGRPGVGVASLYVASADRLAVTSGLPEVGDEGALMIVAPPAMRLARTLKAS